MSKPLSIHDMPDNERPRERLMNHGAEALSTSELLAIIIGTGTPQENVLHLSERILAHHHGLHGLAQATPSDLRQIKGLGTAKISQIVAALELGKRLARFGPDERPLIQNAADAARLTSDMRYLMQEHVRVILLDSASRVVAMPTVYIGTLNATVLRIAEIYREAVARNCPAIILVHNHPSGNPSPSPEDIELTRAILAAGQLLDVELLDHIIIGHQDWVSLKKLNLGFEAL
ncbi:MAG: JAB domain-containing protein [Chloroflexi bacterium]|nr:MAG: hypothetical protein CUN54_06560 [Phototrophicales bacterium]RMF76975.1 MAG: JAB domain-containing protein [Chloroflexota bacterium]